MTSVVILICNYIYFPDKVFLIKDNILKPSSNRSTYIFMLVQRGKHKVYKIHVFLS